MTSNPLAQLEALKKQETDIAVAVGRLAIEFARLEHSVSELVTAAFGCLDIPSLEAINSVLSFRQKLDLIAALAPSRLRRTEELSAVQDCVRILGEFEAERNALLHAFWSYEPEASGSERYVFFQRKTKAHRKKGLVFTKAMADPKKIEQLSQRVTEYRNLFGGRLYGVADHLYRAARGLKPNEP